MRPRLHHPLQPLETLRPDRYRPPWRHPSYNLLVLVRAVRPTYVNCSWQGILFGHLQLG